MAYSASSMPPFIDNRLGRPDITSYSLPTASMISVALSRGIDLLALVLKVIVGKVKGTHADQMIRV